MAEQKRWLNDLFPVGIWVTPPVDEISSERYREIREAGITFMSGFTEWTGGLDIIRKSLDMAQENGLKIIIADPRVRHAMARDTSMLPEILQEFSGHPAFMGHNVCDEPSIAQIAELADLAERYRMDLPDALPFVNLFPTYASEQQLGGTYADYLEQFMSCYKPEVLSYDHYPFLVAKHDDSPDISPQYFYNLHLIREQALLHDVPFWLFIQTLSFNNTNRDPVEEEIRWQVYTSLAYGAKGIQYFTYWTPENGVETFGDAMIDRDGNKTRHYGEVQAVNRELHAIGPILLGLRSTGIRFHGFEPESIPVLTGTVAPIQALSGDPVIIGGFEDTQGKEKLIVVNQSFRQPAEISLTFRAEAGRYAAIWTKGSRTSVNIDSNGILALSLQPGEGKLLELEQD
ncbi:beta-galactosidase [Paenibacillus mendelii]|uniref:Beta-galactosidase n=1 Tax=Paenibacillus mendelii TaxID=206163 RepID=A0ABV6JFU8_9BACL|nr:beta-galactosidase [Paenibacillus mendelii]MCQ6557679.1 beta-galactosidase [Paenibacillus mendelii]